MKKVIFGIKHGLKVILVAAIVVTSCTTYGFQNTIRGNGNIISEERPASSFNAIKVAEGVEVIISNGDEESIKVEADENVIKYIKTEIRNNELYVHVGDNVRLKNCKKTVYVNYTKLKRAKASSGGQLKSTETLTGNNLELKASSGGILKLEIEVNELDARTSSGGIMRLRGTANELDISASSGGILNAGNLDGEGCDVNVSSGGMLEIGEYNSIDANASSGGMLTYSGNPTQRNIRKSSGGMVTRN